jgi:twitching motility protein PilT
LVTGPTGSGKSTSLVAMLEYINGTRNANLITIEDPIEFIFDPQKCIISQREI